MMKELEDLIAAMLPKIPTKMLTDELARRIGDGANVQPSKKPTSTYTKTVGKRGPVATPRQLGLGRTAVARLRELHDYATGTETKNATDSKIAALVTKETGQPISRETIRKVGIGGFRVGRLNVVAICKAWKALSA